MLLRHDDRGVLAIGQASHAWLSGQLARAWGNARFPPPMPREEVCLAAEQHDVGMAMWDLEPTLNPRTGLPHSFLEMPLATHLELWSAAPGRLITQCRYAALLVSMHGSRLYRRRDLKALSEADAEAVLGYLAAQERFQAELTDSLAGDPLALATAQERSLERNSQLLWTWDVLSLAICLGERSRAVSAVPTSEGEIEMQLWTADSEDRVLLHPWPFQSGVIAVRCEGRRLSGSHDSEHALSAALSQARWETVQFELAPGEAGD